MTSATFEFSRLLDDCRQGDSQAAARLITLVYADLQRLARAQRGHSEGNRTLNTTSLVHECYLRIAGDATHSVESRAHFFNLASRVMRQVLCDYARQRIAAKRGGGAMQACELIELDDLLKGLEREQQRAARVFECRYFAGLSEQETADALDISLRTAQREWNLARAWLAERLRG
jgi:RNA polymerase sigma factor (TIGR02999 family)